MLRFESIEFGTRETREHLWISETTSRGYDVKQLSRDNVDFITAGERDVFKITMHRNAEILSKELHDDRFDMTVRVDETKRDIVVSRFGAVPRAA